MAQTGLTPKAVITSRIKEADKSLHQLKRKMHVLRQFVLGDWSAIDPEAAFQPDTYLGRKVRETSGSEDFEKWTKILVTEYEEGLSNMLLQTVRNLAFRSCFRTPSIDFEEADPIEAAVMSAYLKRVFADCHAWDHQRAAFLDYLITGYGWTWCSQEASKPAVRMIDSLDMLWDTSVTLLPDTKWRAVRVSRPIGQFIEDFGSEAGFSDLLDAKDGSKPDPTRYDQVATLVYYFDIERTEGTYAVVRDDQLSDDEPHFFDHVRNPHYVEHDGYRQAIFPLEAIYYLVLPSTRFSVSTVEMMLAQQIMLRMAERVAAKTMKASNPVTVVHRDAFESADLAKIKEGEVGEVLISKNGQGINVQPGIDIPKTVIEQRDRAMREIPGNAGDNPYSSGKPIDGIKFASETVAIQNDAGIALPNMALDAADHWRRVASLTIANARYHETPLTLRVDGEDLVFGPDSPISAFMRPDIVPTVSEDSLQWQSRSQRVAQYAQMLQMAANPAVAAVAPNSVRVLYEQALRSFGVTNVAEHFEPPATAMPLPGAPALDPTIEADIQ